MKFQAISFHKHLKSATLDKTQRPGQARSLADQQKMMEDRQKQQELELKKLQELVFQMNEAMADLEARRSQSLTEMQSAAVELAVLVASRVVHEKISKDDFAIDQLVKSMIDQLPKNEKITIHLNPEDLSSLQTKITQKEIQFDSELVKFEAQTNLHRGDCYADAGDLGLTTTLEQSLEKLRYELMQGLDDAQTERRKIGTPDRALQRFPERRETA